MEHTKSACKAVKELTEEVVTTTEKMKLSAHIADVCKYYKELDDAIDLLESYTKILRGSKEDLVQNGLHDLIESSGMESVRVGNYNYTPDSSYYFNIPEDKREKGLDWLRKAGYEMLIKEGVNPQSLTTVMREYVKEKGEFPPEEAITKFPKKVISVRKAK